MGQLHAGDASADPQADNAKVFSESQLKYWAFQPVVRPEVAAVENSDFVRTPIDAFLLSRLEDAGLAFSGPADRLTLLRRVKFDLLGLPPTPKEIEEFAADEAADAYERMIDRFLASPHYGEKWGRSWLDLVRYAETAGFNADPARPLAYKYRDYVIKAFNDDTPYDRFVQEQLAGDELFPGNPEALIATGYNRLWPDESNASNILLARQDALNDLTGNVGAVFMGLSIGCAQCHDHKFDPILQTDFYQLQAFFSGIVPVDQVPVGNHEELVQYQSDLAEWTKDTQAIRDEIQQLEQPAVIEISHVKRLKFPKVVLDAIDTASEKRSAFQHQLAFWSERQIEFKEKDLLKKLTDEQQARRDELHKQLKEMTAKRPQPPQQLQAMATVELPTGVPEVHLLAGGSYNKPVRELPPGYLAIVEGVGTNAADVQAPRAGTSGRRATLARWLTDPKNPLAARVMANRIWQGHFDRGIVENANDLGIQTQPPSHPELLDWLASEFVARGWSIKAMHRLIMTSTAYRQSTHPDAAGDADPGNRLYGHYPRRRLTAESIRDSMLAIAGELNSDMYGAGVRPELPPNYSKREAWPISKDAGDRSRRSIYIYAKRNLPYPLLQVFDLPDMHESCALRSETTVAPQALMVLNSEMILDFATAFAVRLLEEFPSADPVPPIERAYELAFARRPTEEEVQLARMFVVQQQDLLTTEAADATENKEPSSEAAAKPASDAANSSPFPEGISPAYGEAMIDFCHVLLNTNEFIYVE